MQITDLKVWDDCPCELPEGAHARISEDGHIAAIVLGEITSPDMVHIDFDPRGTDWASIRHAVRAAAQR